MAKFKCKHSGNVFTFTSDFDIRTMRQHSEYEEVVEDSFTHGVFDPKQFDEVKTDVRRGRPPKEVK